MSGSHGMSAEAKARVQQAWLGLAAVGARRTLARALVVEVLARAAGHLSVTAIHEQIAGDHPEVNISTVHRTVAFLVDNGVAHVLPRPGEALYGLADEPHHHAVCDVCGAVSEIPAPAMSKAVAAAEDSSDFQIRDAGLAVFGRCPACRRRTRAARSTADGSSRPRR
jgi:Fur family transcriptional regulator, ferric uptake regulator